MHCPECNINNEQRKIIAEYNRPCGCCNGTKHISFHRFVQWNLGWVCWLDGFGNEASVYEMNVRCESIIKDCYKKLGKKINRTWNKCENYEMSSSEVTSFYASQFQGKDCLKSSNY